MYMYMCPCVCLKGAWKKRTIAKFVLSLSVVCYNNKAQGSAFEECIVVQYTNENLKHTSTR